MPSNYEPIGQHIRLVDVRNSGLKVERLVGLSITKRFIPSVANTVGTDMSNYKIIKKGQFACSIMQVRRDGKMPVALMQEFDEAIISPAYPVFEVIDEAVLLPEYLMMWFTRSEFDRHACFLAVGGVRGSLEWDDFLEMELPVPHIDVQRAMVKEYNTITQRIALNEQLNQKLEETAQTLYRHWFVDFEFPYDFEKGEPSLQGQPYKSSGGEMQWCEELEKEIPKGWYNCTLGELCAPNVQNIEKPKTGIPLYYYDTSSITNNRFDQPTKLVPGIDVIPGRAKRKAFHGDVVFGTVRPNLRHFGIVINPNERTVFSTGFTVLHPKEGFNCGEMILLRLWDDETLEVLHGIAEMSMSTYPTLGLDDLLMLKLACPRDKKLIDFFRQAVSPCLNRIWVNDRLSDELGNLRALILSKMSTVETGVAGGVGVG